MLEKFQNKDLLEILIKIYMGTVGRLEESVRRLHSAHSSMVNTVHSAQCTMHSTHNSLVYTVHSEQCTVHSCTQLNGKHRTPLFTRLKVLRLELKFD